MTNEGYASYESLHKAVEILKELREVGMTNLMGEDQCIYDKATRWVADLGA